MWNADFSTKSKVFGGKLWETQVLLHSNLHVLDKNQGVLQLQFNK